MSKTYGIQLAIEALSLLNKNPPEIEGSLEELSVGRSLSDFDEEDYLRLLELQAKAQNLNEKAPEEIQNLKIDIGELCENIIGKEKNG